MSDTLIDVPRMFRLSAVRRPPHDRAADQAAGSSRVYDEELVDALWAERDRFQERLVERANVEAPHLRIAAVRLEGIAPASSVIVRLVFVVRLEAAATAASAGFSGAVITSVSEALERALGAPVAVSAFPEPPPAAVAKADAAATPLGRLTPFLAAIGSGIGVIGFVTFMGGTIVWARVRAAGLPTAPTLGVFPNQDLLVIGAETLVPMFFTALLAVAVLAVGYAVVRALIKDHPRGDRLLNHEARYRAGEETMLATVGMFVFVLLALGVPLVRVYDSLKVAEVIAGSAGVVIGALVAAVVASFTRRFLHLATTTFVLSAVFLGFVAYWRAGNEEMIRGAAIIRENKKAVTGIYVAEGSGRVYLALLTLAGDGKIDKSRSRLVGIAKSQVTDIAVADRKAPRSALDEATALAKELCASQPKLAAPTGGAHLENCVTAPPGEPQP